MNYESKVKKVCDFVQLNLDENLDLEKVYKISQLSRFHFHRIFSAYLGISMNKFIYLCKLKRASYQLVFVTNKNILEIALETGFESHEAFSRSFKKTFGQTPSEFRLNPNWQNWHEKFDYILPKKDLTMNVEIVQREREKIAYLSHFGSPKTVLETANEFVKWRKETGLSPISKSKTYGIPFADPNEIDENKFRFDIAGTIEEDLTHQNDQIKQTEIPKGRFAKIHYIGSHDGLSDCVYYLYRHWLPENNEEAGDFPVFFQYHNFIHQVSDHELITDIFLLLK